MLELIAFFQEYSASLQIFAIVFLTLLFSYSFTAIIDYFEKRSEHTEIGWDNALIYAVRKPVKIIIYI